MPSGGLESLTKVPCVSPRLISLNYCSIYQQNDNYDTQHFNNTHFYWLPDKNKFCDHKISLDYTDIALQMANFLQVINPNKSSFQ